MENTVLKNIISNFDLMANDHFLDWFKENKEVLLEKEKQQIIDSYLQGFCHCEYEGIIDAQKYYKETFNNK